MKVIKCSAVKKDPHTPLTAPTASDHSVARENLRQQLETIANMLADAHGSIRVSYSTGDRTTVYVMDCPQECLGQIIGSGGKTITSLRNIFTAISARIGFRCVIEIPYYSQSVAK